MTERWIQEQREGLFKSILWPAMIYGSKSWPIKGLEKELDVGEMRMVKWMMGKPRKNPGDGRCGGSFEEDSRETATFVWIRNEKRGEAICKEDCRDGRQEVQRRGRPKKRRHCICVSYKDT